MLSSKMDLHSLSEELRWGERGVEDFAEKAWRIRLSKDAGIPALLRIHGGDAPAIFLPDRPAVRPADPAKRQGRLYPVVAGEFGFRGPEPAGRISGEASAEYAHDLPQCPRGAMGASKQVPNGQRHRGVLYKSP